MRACVRVCEDVFNGLCVKQTFYAINLQCKSCQNAMYDLCGADGWGSRRVSTAHSDGTKLKPRQMRVLVPQSPFYAL